MQAFSAAAAASCVPYTRSLSALNKVETLLLIEIIFLKCNDVETNCHFNYFATKRTEQKPVPPFLKKSCILNEKSQVTTAQKRQT